MTQLNLPTIDPLDIKSPIFKPRPGWGGQLKNWLKRHSKSFLPLIALIILAIGIWVSIFD